MRVGVTREFNWLKFLNMTEINTNEITDLAQFIDADQTQQRLDAINAAQQQQPLPDEVVIDEPVPDIPQLSENPARVANVRAQESRQRVAAGNLFHGWIRKWECRRAANGSPYLRFEVELECNQWRMTHTKFLPKDKIDTTEHIAQAQDFILQNYGYDFNADNDPSVIPFPGLRLFEIGSWKSDDDKEHLNVKYVYLNEADYNRCQIRIYENKQKKQANKKKWQAPDCPLPQRGGNA